MSDAFVLLLLPLFYVVTIIYEGIINWYIEDAEERNARIEAREEQLLEEAVKRWAEEEHYERDLDKDWFMASRKK